MLMVPDWRLDDVGCYEGAYPESLNKIGHDLTENKQ